MSTESELHPVVITADPDPLLRAVAAYLARFKGATRTHTDSDLRAYLGWCRRHGLDPLRANGSTSSCTCAGCKRSATSNPPPSPDASRSSSGSTATACCPPHPPITYGAPTCHPSRPPWA